MIGLEGLRRMTWKKGKKYMGHFQVGHDHKQLGHDPLGPSKEP